MCWSDHELKQGLLLLSQVGNPLTTSRQYADINLEITVYKAILQ